MGVTGTVGAARPRAVPLRGAVATAVVPSVLVGPLPLVPLGGPAAAPAAAATCGAVVDAALAAPDAATGTAALQAALDAAAGADPSCTAWTVVLTGTFDLVDDLVHAVALPLVLEGPEGARAELRGGGSARLLTLRRPATEVTLRRLVLRGGDATGTDLAGAGGAVGAEVAPLADPTPSRITVLDALLVGNTAASGGAIAADVVALTDVDLVGNAAPLGGAVDVGTLTATRVQFVGNAATLPPGQGGAVRAAGDVTLVTVTLTGNAASAGGSVWMSGAVDPVLRATATTFADARADDGGHVLADLTLGGGVRAVLRGTVLAGVTALTGGGPVPAVCAGLVVHAGPAPDVTVAALATDASCPGATPLDAEPTLAALDGAAGRVEGRTRLLVPAPDGPLVDVAACADVWPATDARGVARPQPTDGACDAGAVEVERAAPTAPPPPTAPAPPPTAPPDLGPPAPAAGDADSGADEWPAVPPVPSAVRSGAVAGPTGPTGWTDLLRRLRRR